MKVSILILCVLYLGYGLYFADYIRGMWNIDAYEKLNLFCQQ